MQLYIWRFPENVKPQTVLKTKRSVRTILFHPQGLPLLLTAEVNEPSNKPGAPPQPPGAAGTAAAAGSPSRGHPPGAHPPPERTPLQTPAEGGSLDESVSIDESAAEVRDLSAMFCLPAMDL